MVALSVPDPPRLDSEALSSGRAASLKQPSCSCLTRQSCDLLNEDLHCCGVCEACTRRVLSPGNIQQRVCSVLHQEMNHVSVLMFSCFSLYSSQKQSGRPSESPESPELQSLSLGPIIFVFRQLKSIQKSKNRVYIYIVVYPIKVAEDHGK